MTATPSPDLYPPLVRIVDDEESVRRSASFTLRVAGFNAVTYESARDFLDRDDLRHPGCVVLDVRMPEMSGLELQQEMLRRGIDLPILFLTGHGDVGMAVSALKLGADDFCEKPIEPAKLREAVNRMTERDIAERRHAIRVEGMRAKYETLTEREKEILRRVALDQMNKQIAIDLDIQEHTVKIHRSNACKKLEVRSALEIHHFLTEIGVLSGGVFSGA